MPYADFQPQQGRDLFGENVNLMSRINADQRAQQEAQRAQAQFQILQPAIQAKAQADIVTAGASIAAYTRKEQDRQEAATQSVPLYNEFTDIMKLVNFGARSDALRAFQGKLGVLTNAAVADEYKPFVEAVNHAALEAHGTDIVQMTHEANTLMLQEKLSQLREANQLKADTALGIADTRANATTASAEIRAGASTPLQKNLAAYEQAKNDPNADPEVVNALKQSAFKQFAPGHASAIDKEMDLRDEAIRTGDTARAQTHQYAINKLQSFASNPIETALPTAREIATSDAKKKASAQRAAPTKSNMTVSYPGYGGEAAPARQEDAAPAVAPTKVDPKATSVKIGGKEYPVYKDKSGNRAYKIDGHYVPIQD